jgi:hypothetical protein
MSILVYSFVWKKGSSSVVIDTVSTTSTSSASVFFTESYILALTNASQTEIDTLSFDEIILKQFKTDYPHIKKLHKQADNVSNFSSHATPECKKVICERVSFCYTIVIYITNVLQGVPEITYQKENCISPMYYDQMS